MRKPFLDIEIDNMPYPEKRPHKSRYENLFKQLKPGQCLKVQPEQLSKTCSALRKYLKETGQDVDYKASTVSMCEDGFARVWMLPRKSIRMADLPGRVVKKLNMEAA